MEKLENLHAQLARYRSRVDTMLDDGRNPDEIEGWIEERELPGDAKSALWLWMWSARTDQPPRRFGPEAEASTHPVAGD